MKYFAVIVAGGVGARMGAEKPKQFLSYKEKPILIHTLEKFINCSLPIEIILVIHPQYLDFTKELLTQFFSTKIVESIKLIAGGSSRFQSVKNGIDTIDLKSGVVAVHDAVRSLLSPELIQKGLKFAVKNGNAIPVISVVDSVRILNIKEGAESIALKRDLLKSVQTPQCFDLQLIKKAYQQKEQNHFTDSASVLEFMGEKIHLFEGETKNIKITRPIDLKIAEWLSEV